MKNNFLAITILIKCFFGLFLFANSSMASEDRVFLKKKDDIRVWSYSAPGRYIESGKVLVKDSSGVLVGTGRTNERGTATIHPAANRKYKFPLMVRVTGGKAGGEKFKGTLLSRIQSEININQINFVDLVSTIAVKISKKGDYELALQKARESLSIKKGAPIDVLRVTNNFVDKDLLDKSISDAGSHDKLVKRLVRNALEGKKTGELKPLNYFERMEMAKSAGVTIAVDKQNGVSATSGSSSPVCSAPLANGSASTSQGSDQIIADLGAIALGGLIQYAGVPSGASSALTGMLLAAINGDSSSQGPTLEAIGGVQTQLDCISSQIGYLSSEITELLYQVELQSAIACSTQIAPAWSNYTWAVNHASSNPLTPNNTSLTGSYLPAWGSINANCGSSINQALFGTAGGQGSAWQTINQMMQSNYPSWYTYVQVQQLQTFLSYWSTLIYQQSVLTAEYNNYYGYNEANLSAFGLATTSNGSQLQLTQCLPGQPISSTNCACTEGTTATSGNFCSYLSNISNAFPPDVYSDEVAIPALGITYSAFPGGIITPWPGNITPETNPARSAGMAGLNTYYIINTMYSENLFGNWSVGGGSQQNFSFPMAPYVSTAMQAFNSYGINQASLPTAVEYWYNPQAPKTLMPTSSQISPYLGVEYFSSTGNTPPMSWLYTVLANTPYGNWNTLGWVCCASSSGAYFTQDVVGSLGFTSDLNWGTGENYPQVSLQFSATDGYYNQNNGFVANTVGNCTNGNRNYPCASGSGGNFNVTGVNVSIALLLGRNWWSESMNSTNYQPPPPPTN